MDPIYLNIFKMEGGASYIYSHDRALPTPIAHSHARLLSAAHC
jgi:hypothetical protein